MRILLKATIAAAIMPSVFVVVAVADDRHVSSLDSTRLFPGADFKDDIDASTQSSNASNNRQSYDGKVYGKASVFPAFIRKMQQATGRIVNLPDGYSFHDHDVQTLYLTESSVRHTDVRVEGRTPLEDSEESLTAFYVQESTADAYFETDDDELCIPYVEGSAIYFNGGLPHQSIVKSGAVKLVGPFLMSTLESVGGPAGWCGTSSTDARKCELRCDDDCECPSSEGCFKDVQCFPPPSSSPSASPSNLPTSSPQVSPSTAPSVSPQVSPSTAPSVSPSVHPSAGPAGPMPTSSKASKSKAPKSSSSLQVQHMKSGGSSLFQTTFVGIRLVSIATLGTFFAFQLMD
eukprot:scaffold9217_cov150-Skeletonema_dohrnii-CCMP3373.AAC.7